MNEINIPQLIAIYFPQFHSIPENDLWWGGDFTDWKLVKSAKPLFDGHYQPKAPLDGIYYNPCDKNTLKKQIEQAQQYGISGFMFYHYWFDGRLILEKPLETLLKNTDLEIPFCISWANASWTRTWQASNEILIEQKHIPDENLWKRHFDYLLPFFSDKRYLKINGKLIFTVHKPEIIKSQKHMFCLWNQWLKENGLSQLYLIATQHNEFNKSSFLQNYNAILNNHPEKAANIIKNQSFINKILTKIHINLKHTWIDILREIRLKNKKTKIIDTEKVWQQILLNANINKYPNYNLDIYDAVFFGWDNTARYGHRANIYPTLSKEQKMKFMQELVDKAKTSNSQFIFFNAWNEWSEGTYLEPDDRYKYENLEVIKSIFI
jgi:lipopolysaccharide biosynthesis protein